MPKDTADYEKSEEIAIAAGKEALSKVKWLHNRKVDLTKGFFVELHKNDDVHPNHYSCHCVDGNGTKIMLSAWSGNYRLAPIDGLAMNANDMATIISAFPDSINLYIACQTEVEEKHMGEIMSGFADGLKRLRIPIAPWDLNIGKIETASLDEMIGSAVPNKGFDIGVVMTGFIEKNKVPHLDPKPGHIIVGVTSTGLHSNGYTGARHVLFGPEVEYRKEWKSQYRGRFGFNGKPAILGGKTVLAALQVPTALYLVDAHMVSVAFGGRTGDLDIYGVNITGNGLKNFNRAGNGVAFHITDPLDPLPIHMLLMQESGWTTMQAYTKQNMGMGFAYIAPTLEAAEELVQVIEMRGENKAKIVGEVTASKEPGLVTLLHKTFEGPLKKPLRFEGYTK